MTDTKAQLHTEVNAVIVANGVGAITGPVLNQVLNDIINAECTLVETFITNIAALRASTSTTLNTPACLVLGYYSAGDHGSGVFNYIASDTTSADNGGTIIVDASSRRWYRSITTGFLTVAMFGAKADGTTDDAAAINAALTAAKSGQEVWLSERGQHLVDTVGLPIPGGVILRSGWNGGGSNQDMETAGDSFNLAGLNGAIILNPSFTITLNNGSQIKGVPVYRKGLTIPAASTSAFTGTAITIAGDDVFIGYVMWLGFNTGIARTTTHTRTWIEWCKGDSINGINLQTSFDIDHIDHIHLWPYCTYIAGNAGTPDDRGGTGITLFGCTEPFVSNCFEHSYLFGYVVQNTAAPVFYNCNGEHDGISSGSATFLIGNGTGGVTGGRFIACTSFSQDGGFNINLPVNDFVELVNCYTNNNSGAINIVQGDVRIYGGTIDTATAGINISASTSNIVVIGTRFQGITSTGVSNTGGSPNVILQSLDLSQYSVGVSVSTTLTAKTVASAGAINIPSFGDFFTITGTTSIGAIGSGWVGRRITLLFSGVLALANGSGASALRLNGGVNFTTASGSTISLISNGTQWFEIGRSA